MKKKIFITAIAMIMAMYTLVGCGKGKVTLSECLSENKVIGYVLSSVDKASIPKDIYFFDNGKVTIIPGRAFGLTMGDFAQMKDGDIWNTYETVRESYIKEYKDMKVSEYISPIQLKIEQEQCLLNGLIHEYSIDNVDDNYDAYNLYLSLYSASEQEQEEIFEQYVKLTCKEISLEEYVDFIHEKVINREISKREAIIAELQDKINSVNADQCVIPFCDIPFQFAIETDASGNNVQSEAMVYPSLSAGGIGEQIFGSFYWSLDFVSGMTREETIYDTTYNCISLTGNKSFLTREVMDLDTLDSKNVLIDLTDDEIEELYREEVMSRF